MDELTEKIADVLRSELEWDWPAEDHDDTCQFGGPIRVPSGGELVKELAEAVAAVVNAHNTVDAAHLTRQREWSARTFGPGSRTAGVLDHIHKELVEVEARPDDITEWADVIILAFDGALRAGHEPQDILDAVKAKQAQNEAREWPDWRTQDPNKAIEHVRPTPTTSGDADV